MKTGFISAALLLLAPAWALAQPSPRSDGGDAQRVVALLDYVAADYAGAVRDGNILSQDEYGEQLRFAGDAHRMAAGILAEGDPLLAEVADVEARVREKASPAEVARESRAAREQVVSRFGLATVPDRRPDAVRARQLFAENCAVCHGATGDGQSAIAATMEPRPANFHDPERLNELSPYRAYNVLTFGVPGTPMPAFDSLTPQERWSLAFFVFRLGHEGQRAAGPVSVPLADLAGHTDRELTAALRGQGIADPAAAVAWARQEAPFQETSASASLDRTRALLQESLAAFDAGDPARADTLVLDAYLQGFEPLEPARRATDPAGTAEIERGFHELRAAMTEGDPDVVHARALRLQAKLAADPHASRTAAVPFLGALLIVFREGVEAALLIGAMLAGVRRLGQPRAVRLVHAGWITALPAGVLTWIVLERVLRWGAAERELMEAGIALLAAVVLFSMSFWMISKVEARRWMEYLRRHVEKSLDGRNLALLAGLAFMAVYREAAETVLFVQALVLETSAPMTHVVAGAIAGGLAAGVIAVLLNKAVTRLPLGPFFAVSSLLLCLLAISFAGSGIYELVSAGLLRPRPVTFPTIPWMGIHPDLTALLVQLTILTVIAAAGIKAALHRPAAQESPRGR